jgi:hypothetical protein
MRTAAMFFRSEEALPGSQTEVLGQALSAKSLERR